MIFDELTPEQREQIEALIDAGENVNTLTLLDIYNGNNPNLDNG